MPSTFDLAKAEVYVDKRLVMANWRISKEKGTDAARQYAQWDEECSKIEHDWFLNRDRSDDGVYSKRIGMLIHDAMCAVMEKPERRGEAKQHLIDVLKKLEVSGGVAGGDPRAKNFYGQVLESFEQASKDIGGDAPTVVNT